MPSPVAAQPSSFEINEWSHSENILHKYHILLQSISNQLNSIYYYRNKLNFYLITAYSYRALRSYCLRQNQRLIPIF
jgi:hypothetical protein